MKIIYRCGNMYTFMSHTLYNIDSLIDFDFEICLVVKGEYQESDWFNNYCMSKSNLKVVVEPRLIRNSLRSQASYLKFAKKLYDIHKPDLLLQNDYIEIENMLLFEISRRYDNIKRRIVVYETQPFFVDLFSIFDNVRINKINVYLKVTRLSNLVYKLLSVVMNVLSVIRNRIIPLLLGVRSYLTQSKYNNINIAPNKKAFDILLTQYLPEKELLKNVLKNGEMVELYDINRTFVRSESALDLRYLLFVPSTLLMGKFDRMEVEKIDEWIRILLRVQSHFKLAKVFCKFHPNLRKNNNLELLKLKEYLNEFTDFTILDEHSDVIPVAFKADLVIGDCSSLLLAVCADVITISIDFNDMPGGDHMKMYPDIYYFEHDAINLSLIAHHQEKAERQINTLGRCIFEMVTS
jgi:hypothetical protein